MKHSKFHYWIIYGFALTILPILLTAVWINGHEDGNATLWDLFKRVISRGELLLVSLALLGTNLGDLFKDECRNPLAYHYLRALSFFLCLIIIFLYSQINSDPTFKHAFGYSLSFFGCSIAVCLISIFTPRK